LIHIYHCGIFCQELSMGALPIACWFSVVNELMCKLLLLLI
jgi:hypothetical protein